MWLCTKDGFYSVVKKGGVPDRPLCLRGRVRRDLENFLNIIGKDAVGSGYMIFKGFGTDYLYRCFISPEDLKVFLTYQAAHLDYNNFKNSIPYSNDGDFRHDVYMDTWIALSRLRGLEDRPHSVEYDNYVVDEGGVSSVGLEQDTDWQEEFVVQ